MPEFITEYPQFLTASIKGVYKLLQQDKTGVDNWRFINHYRTEL